MCHSVEHAQAAVLKNRMANFLHRIAILKLHRTAESQGVTCAVQAYFTAAHSQSQREKIHFLTDKKKAPIAGGHMSGLCLWGTRFYRPLGSVFGERQKRSAEITNSKALAFRGASARSATVVSSRHPPSMTSTRCSPSRKIPIPSHHV